MSMVDAKTGAVREPQAFYWPAHREPAPAAPEPKALAQALVGLLDAPRALVVIDAVRAPPDARLHYLRGVADEFTRSIRPRYVPPEVGGVPAVMLNRPRLSLQLLGRIEVVLKSSDEYAYLGIQPTHFFRGLP